MTKYGLVILAACLLVATGCRKAHTRDDSGIILMDGGGPLPDAGGGTPDTGGAPVDSGGISIDAGGGVADTGPRADSGATGIDCMGSTCDPATQHCCITGMPGGGATGMCVDLGTMCMGAAVDCDGPEDCGGGEVCCARGSLSGITVGCEPASDGCGTGGFGEFELCHDVADCSGAGDMCCPISMGGFSGAYCSGMCFGTGGP